MEILDRRISSLEVLGPSPAPLASQTASRFSSVCLRGCEEFHLGTESCSRVVSAKEKHTPACYVSPSVHRPGSTNTSNSLHLTGAKVWAAGPGRACQAKRPPTTRCACFAHDCTGTLRTPALRGVSPSKTDSCTDTNIESAGWALPDSFGSEWLRLPHILASLLKVKDFAECMPRAQLLLRPLDGTRGCLDRRKETRTVPEMFPDSEYSSEENIHMKSQTTASKLNCFPMRHNTTRTTALYGS